MKRAIVLALVVGCGGATNAPAKSRPTPTESDACERICAVYTECGITPPNCTAMCDADHKKLRDGIHPSLAACLESELGDCTRRAMTERRQIAALCQAAVIDLYAKDDSALDRVIQAECAREAKCAADPEPDCAVILRARLKGSPQSKAAAVMRPEVLTKITDCIAASGCNDPDPNQTCSPGGP